MFYTKPYIKKKKNDEYYIITLDLYLTKKK